MSVAGEDRRDTFTPRWHTQRSRIGHLTAREYEVLMLLERGLDNLQISRILMVGERTVKVHLTHVLRKLGVQSRLQAGLVAAEHVFLDGSLAQLDRLTEATRSLPSPAGYHCRPPAGSATPPNQPGSR
jgi:DNA-binding CsgD family transcriptional regulator